MIESVCLETSLSQSKSRFLLINPVFAEIIEPTLEEIFIYEMEAKGYDVGNILG